MRVLLVKFVDHFGLERFHHHSTHLFLLLSSSFGMLLNSLIQTDMLVILSLCGTSFLVLNLQLLHHL